MLTEILIISLMAGIVSIDVRTIGGTMISRPLVISPLVGLILGDLKVGFIVATFLELIWIGLPPIGAYLPAETLPIAVISTSLAIILKGKMEVEMLSIIVFCIIVAIPFGFIGKWLEYHIRTFNSYLSRKVSKEVEKGNIESVCSLQYFNILLSFLKGFVICFIPILFGQILLIKIFNSLPNQIKEGILFSSWFVLALGFAVVMEIFILNKYIKYFFISFFVLILLFLAIGVM
ncbi:MAG: PTS sugar transporter subunit IIC [Candidatus Firestonebacteria bacterium]